MTRFVIDASIVLTWCFPDENAAVADRATDLFKQGGTASVPSFWAYEVVNALLVGEKRKRISQALVKAFLDDLAILAVTVEQSAVGMVFTTIQSLCREHGLTTYDAAYLELAIRSELPLATLDQDLILACNRAGVPLV